MLSEKHEQFCREFLVDGNAAQAYIRTGYEPKGAKQAAYRLLENPEIQSRIAELNKVVLDKLEVTNERIIAELAKIGFANATDFVNGGNTVLELKHMERDKTAAVSKIKTIVRESADGQVTTTTELGFWDKVEALTELAKIRNMFSEHQKYGAGIANLVIPDNVSKAIDKLLDDNV